MTENNALKIDLESMPLELQQLVKYQDIDEALYATIVTIHKETNEIISEVWETIPPSARNVLDSYEQFHALVSVSQCLAGIDFWQETQGMKINGMSDDAIEEYKASLLDKVLNKCVSELVKQLKKARMKPSIKREFKEMFSSN